MPMHLPSVRMGLMPQHVALDPYDGGMGDYGALALQANPGSRDFGGVRWTRSKKRMAQCKGFADAVAKYNQAERELKRAGCKKFAIFPRKKCKQYRNRMKAAESEGKSAWKVCEAQRKGEEKGYTQRDESAGFMSSSGMMGPEGSLIDPLTGLPMDPLAMSSEAGLPAEEEPSRAGLYAAGLLLLGTAGFIVYKRKKKSR